ncbi:MULTISPECIES: class I SAM-dependent methyltransferase [unclassified Pandoraea]|uniref:class I SAM-dependent methyltransferase n=1 Tax=unclassified Pandoraea TaxID=2624094 RepID=UPI00034AFF48|nr:MULTISPECIES: class I SAM-dependent methyltransferase [unclassified Pandoraea]
MKGVTKYSGPAQIYFRHLLRQIVGVGQLNRPDIKILDFGCGVGQLKQMLGPRVIGYDIVPELSDVDDWRSVNFDVLVANEVFYSFSESDLDNLLKELRSKNRDLELVVGISRQGALNNIGKFLLGRPDAHSATRVGPKKELEVFERHCTIVRRKNVWNLANVYSFVFR